MVAVQLEKVFQRAFGYGLIIIFISARRTLLSKNVLHSLELNYVKAAGSMELSAIEIRPVKSY